MCREAASKSNLIAFNKIGDSLFMKRKANIDIKRGWKKCSKCNLKKSLENFYFRPRGDYRSCCYDCYLIPAKPRIYSRGDKLFRICSTCDKEKEINNFGKCKKGINGISPRCKRCVCERAKIDRDKNRDKIRLRQKIKIKTDEKFRLKRNLQSKKYKEKDKEKWKKYSNEYNKKRLATDPAFKLKHNLRVDFGDFIRRGTKVKSVIKLIGCEINDFRIYLENQFDLKMNWDNYGSYWHLDHIVPQSLFNHLNQKEIELCYNYHNFQPLEANMNVCIKRNNLFISKQHLLKKIEINGMDSIYQKLLYFLNSKILEYNETFKVYSNN